MRLLRRLGRDDLAWSLRRLHVPVSPDATVLEVGSGGNPFPRSDVLLDAYEVTRERHFEPLVSDRPTVLGVIEDLPFRDDAFDFVIACHVVEHCNDISASLHELQRVARAGYIECPDAFFERINPYKDHRYEVTDRNGVLVTRRKRSWIRDTELVELYEHQLKQSSRWLNHFRENPFPFHVRFYWSRETGGIRHLDLTPVEERSLPFEAGPSAATPQLAAHGLRASFTRLVRNTIARSMHRRRIDLVMLLRCMKCRRPTLRSETERLVCGSCGFAFDAKPVPRMFPPLREPAAAQ